MTMKYIWRSFQPRLSFSRPFQQSLACFRVARSPSNSWASCFHCRIATHSQMNCRKRLSNIYHLTTIIILLSHYLAKVECSSVQLCYFTTWYSMQMWCRIVYLQYLSTRDTNFCFLCLRRLICNRKTCVKIVCPQHMHTALTCTQLTPPVNGCVSDELLNAAVQNV